MVFNLPITFKIAIKQKLVITTPIQIDSFDICKAGMSFSSLYLLSNTMHIVLNRTIVEFINTISLKKGTQDKHIRMLIKKIKIEWKLKSWANIVRVVNMTAYWKDTW